MRRLFRRTGLRYRNRIENRKNLFHSSKISISINNYGDIFSDFDPRPYSQRALSDDFLSETKKASLDKQAGKFELDFLLPQRKRNLDNEKIIKRRLRMHFNRHYDLAKSEMSHIIKKGAAFSVMGIIFMFSATLLHFKFSEPSLLISFFIVLLEPAGWFSFWEGLYQIVFESKTVKPELDFYTKMSKCKINFLSYKTKGRTGI